MTLRIFVLLLFALFICSCGDSVQYKETEPKFLVDKIFDVPENSYYILDTLEPADTVFVKQGQTKRLRAAAYLEDKLLDTNRLPDYYFFRFWNYGNNNYTTEHITVQADSTRNKACIYSIDFFGDTTITCIHILIDTPFELKAKSPVNNQSPIDLGKPTKFKVEALGIDPWEKASCDLFVSSELKNLHNAGSLKKSNFDCNKEQSITLTDNGKEVFYWTVTANLYGQKDTTKVSTEPMRFFAKPKNNEPVVILPIVYENARSKSKNGILTLTSNDSTAMQFQIAGDTILYIQGLSNNASYKAVVEETKFTDYAKDSIEFTVLENAFTLLDTLKLIDKIAPEAIPLQPSFAHEDSIRFFVAENGSGINALKTAVTISGTSDSIAYRYNGSRIAFALNCHTYCNAYIHLEDNAKNRADRKAWKISFELDSIRITGPFLRETAIKTELQNE